eukprot:Pgem_evm1s19338
MSNYVVNDDDKDCNFNFNMKTTVKHIEEFSKSLNKQNLDKNYDTTEAIKLAKRQFFADLMYTVYHFFFGDSFLKTAVNKNKSNLKCETLKTPCELFSILKDCFLNYNIKEPYNIKAFADKFVKSKNEQYQINECYELLTNIKSQALQFINEDELILNTYITNLNIKTPPPKRRKQCNTT